MESPSAPTEAGRSLPSISVVFVNYNDTEHLDAFLESVAALDYPSGLYDVICVDNGSTDGSPQLLRDRYPWVRVVENGANLGFAAAMNVGVAASTRECVALVNPDMHVNAEWLRELAGLYDPADGTTCVASMILDWDGERIDFVQASVSYDGQGHQLFHGTPVADLDLEALQGAEIILACGGAFLVSRDVYLDVGGFDASYFGYFEDVDLCWRLWLFGHRIRLSTRAFTFHRHHGTTDRFPHYQRGLLQERNALRSLVKNLDDDNLARFVAASVLLLAKRAQLQSGSDRASYDMGAQHMESDSISPWGMARLHAIGDIVDEIDRLAAERARVQHRRVRSDDEIFRHFGWPFLPS